MEIKNRTSRSVVLSPAHSSTAERHSLSFCPCRHDRAGSGRYENCFFIHLQSTFSLFLIAMRRRRISAITNLALVGVYTYSNNCRRRVCVCVCWFQGNETPWVPWFCSTNSPFVFTVFTPFVCYVIAHFSRPPVALANSAVCRYWFCSHSVPTAYTYY